MSLFADKSLSFSPQLAATIGLEQAILLGLLHDVARYRDTSGWVVLREQQLSEWLPFWLPQDVQRISQNLQAQGLLVLRGAPYLSSQVLDYQLPVPAAGSPSVKPRPLVATPVQAEPVRTAPATVAGASRPVGAQLLDGSWQPDAELLRQLMQLGVDREFALALLPEFVSYWRQKRVAHTSWGNRFLKHAVKCWREHQQAQARREQSVRLVDDWWPGEDALAIMLRDGVDRQFIENCVPEFVLYWRDRGEVSSTWDSKFLQHVRHQWASYTATLGNDKTPRLITADWQPSQDAYDILHMAAIDLPFARQQVPEFVLYWLESGQPHPSWNTRFITHVKYRWARRHDQKWQGETDGFVATHTDRSWADDF